MKVLILAAIFQLWYLLNLMDIQDLKHLHQSFLGPNCTSSCKVGD
jgi:hypothetical protein